MAVVEFVCVSFVFFVFSLIASSGLTHAFVITPVVPRALSVNKRVTMFRRPSPLLTLTHSRSPSLARSDGHRYLARADEGREDEDVPILQWDEESEQEQEEEEGSDEVDADREREREREPSVDELAAMEEELLHMEGEICAEDDLSGEELLSFEDLASLSLSGSAAAGGGGADDRVGTSLVRAAMLDGRERSMRADGQFMD